MTKPKAPLFTPKMLTPEEIEDLRQDRKRRHDENQKALETMDLSRLMPDDEDKEKSTTPPTKLKPVT